MNSTYSLAYSRAGLGEDFFSAHRDRVIAAVVALGFNGAVIGFSSFWLQPVFRPQAKATTPVTVFETHPLDDLEPVTSGAPAGQPSTKIAPLQRPDFVPAHVPSPFVQPFQPPIFQIQSPSQRIIVDPPGMGGDGPGTGRLWEIGDLDRSPLASYQAPPLYPQQLRAMGLSGQAVVDFVVDRSGNVRDAAVVSCSDSEFGAAALKGVDKWKFKPGMKGGRAVDVHMRVPIVFSVEQ